MPWYSENGGELFRLPAKLKGTYRKPVWELAKSPSGGRIRFRTNSSDVAIRLEYPGPPEMEPNVHAYGQTGVDLCADGAFRGTAIAGLDANGRGSGWPISEGARPHGRTLIRRTGATFFYPDGNVSRLKTLFILVFRRRGITPRKSFPKDFLELCNDHPCLEHTADPNIIWRDLLPMIECYRADLEDWGSPAGRGGAHGKGDHA